MVEIRNAYKSVVGKLEGNRPREGDRHTQDVHTYIHTHTYMYAWTHTQLASYLGVFSYKSVSFSSPPYMLHVLSV
jgi:hypothetical protein